MGYRAGFKQEKVDVSDKVILNPAQLLTKWEKKKKKASTENSVLDLSKLLYPLSLYFVLAQMRSVSDVTSKKKSAVFTSLI